MTTALTATVLLLAPAGAASAQSANDRAEARMIEAINDVRGQHGLHGLRRSSSLMGSAGRFSHWLMEHDTFRHLSRIPASSRFALLGEALAMHSGRKFAVRDTLRRWMASPSHRAIVLSRTMAWVGTGATRGRYGAMRATTWVLHVGRLAASAPAPPRLPIG
jgi:uncharacterized protein YkwD